MFHLKPFSPSAMFHVKHFCVKPRAELSAAHARMRSPLAESNTHTLLKAAAM